MEAWNTIVEVANAVAVDSDLGRVLGPYGSVAFLAVTTSLIAAALGVAARGIAEQLRRRAA